MSAVLPSDAAGSNDDHYPCAVGIERRRTLAGAGAMAAAVLAQGAARSAGAGAAAVLIAIAVAAACAVAWTKRSRVRHADVVIATAAFGGLGMTVGGWITCAASKEGMHHGMMTGGWIARVASTGDADHGMMHCAPAAASPYVATGVMVLTCIAACEWTCAPLCRGGWVRRMGMHAIVAAGMLAGMWAAGALFGHASAAHGATTMHAAMVIGMAIGAAAVLKGVDRLTPAGA